MIKKLLALAAVLASASSVVQAAPTVYFGENQAAGGTVSGAPTTARTSFLAALTGVSSEGFESFAVGDPAPLDLSFTGSSSSLAAQLQGSGGITNDTTFGRFNTTPGGSKWWENSGAFTITFATAISAFGFYGTDIGDFNGQITIDLTDSNDLVTHEVVQNTVNGNDGALLFWGFIDAGTAYKKITFGNTGAGTDFFGFDDMVIGDLEQVCRVNCGGVPIPEPGSLALAGLALAGLGLSRRKTRA